MKKRRGWLLIILSALAALAVAWSRGLRPDAEHSAAFAALSDGFFTVGMTLLCVGLLVRIRSTGLFDGLSYGLEGIWFRLTSVLRPRERPDYYAFKQARQALRKPPGRLTLILGIVYLGIAGAALLLYAI